MIRHTLYICVCLFFAPSVVRAQEPRINFAKQIKLENGTAAAVAIPVGAVDRGLYSDGTNLNFSVNGTQKMRITQNGRIEGISHVNSSNTLSFGNGNISESHSGYEGVFLGIGNAQNLASSAYTYAIGHGNLLNASTASSVIAFGKTNLGAIGGVHNGTFAVGINNLNSATSTYLTMAFGAVNNMPLAQTTSQDIGFGNYLGEYYRSGSNNTWIGGFYVARSQVIPTNTTIIGSGAGQNFVLSTNSYTISTVNTGTNEMTLNAALPSQFTANTVFWAAFTAGTPPTPLTLNSQLAFTVVNSTTIKPRDNTLTSITTGATLTRYIDNLNNASAFGANTPLDKSNQMSFGDANVSEIAFAGLKYRYDVSPTLSMGDNGKFFAYNSVTNKFSLTLASALFTDTHLGNSNLTLSSNRTVTTAGFSTTWQGNAPIFNINSNVANTESNVNLSNPNNNLNIKLDNSGGKYNVTTGGNYFYTNGVYYGGVSNVGISAKSSSASYPAFNLIDALQTGWDGSTSNIIFKIAGVTRATLDNANTFLVGTGATNEYISKLTLRGWNGVSASEDADILNNGSIGLRHNVITGRRHYFYVGASEIATINSTGIGVGTTNPSTTLHLYAANDDIAKIETGNKANAGVSFKSNNKEFVLKSIDGQSFVMLDSTNGVYPLQYTYNAFTILSNGYGGVVVLPSGRIGLNTGVPKSTVHVNGSISKPLNTITVSVYNLTESDYALRLTLAGSQTINQPDATTCEGRIYLIINPTNTAKTFGTSYYDFTNATSTTIPTNSSITIQSNGTSWYRTH